MTQDTSKPNKLPLILIFFVVLVDITCWGMVIPILPTYAQRFRADEETVGLLLATYSLAQLICAPLLGRLSDRIGRKPVLVVSMLGTIIAALVTGLASAMTGWGLGFGLALLFVARALDGITGGNISTAQSYIADITTPEKRSQGMGMIGAAIGLGYTFGPAFGGIISRHFGIAMPFYIAAGVAFCNMVAMWLFLPESISARVKQAAHQKVNRIAGIVNAFRNPQINGLLLVAFLMTCAAILYMSMMPLFTKQQLGFTEERNSYLFAFMGLVTTLVQGGLIRPLVRRTGEVPLLIVGLIVLGLSLSLTAQAYVWQNLYLFTAGLAIGTALSNPTVMGLISRRSSAEEQGETIGIAASVGSLARIVGPTWGGFAFKHFGPHLPFYSGTVACLVALLILALAVPRTETSFKTSEEAAARS